MLGTKSAITLALACCLLPTLSPAAPHPPPANIHLELSLRRFAAHNTNRIEFTFRLGTHEGTTLPFSSGSLRNLDQLFESLRDAVRELYCKQRHMA